MFTTVRAAHQMSGVAASTVNTFIRQHPEFGGKEGETKPLPMYMIHDAGDDYGWNLFWNKPSSILPITPEQLEFARAYVSEHVGDKIPAVQKDYIESAKTHAEHVQRARALMDAMKRPERVAFYADFATKFFGATATPPEKADESMEVFQARGKSPAPSKSAEIAEEKKAAPTTAEPERSKKVDDAVLLIARTFVAMQKQALPIKTALGNAWVGETIRGVVGPLMLSNKDRAELIKLLGG